MKFPTQKFIEEFKKTPGAISVCEACAIHWLGTQANKEGFFIDIGSNAGKAAMSAASGIQNGTMCLVDPIYDLTNLEAFKHSVQGKPENIPWSYVFEPDFKNKVMDRIIDVSDMTPSLIGDYSLSALAKFENYGYVFLDSDDHDLPLIMSELRIIEDKMLPGGIIAFHDFRNQYSGPYEAYKYLLTTGKYEEIEIPWDEIRAYVSENNLEEGNDSWHMPGHVLPCFVGAVRKK